MTGGRVVGRQNYTYPSIYNAICRLTCFTDPHSTQTYSTSPPAARHINQPFTPNPATAAHIQARVPHHSHSYTLMGICGCVECTACTVRTYEGPPARRRAARGQADLAKSWPARFRPPRRHSITGITGNIIIARPAVLLAPRRSQRRRYCIARLARPEWLVAYLGTRAAEKKGKQPIPSEQPSGRPGGSARPGKERALGSSSFGASRFSKQSVAAGAGAIISQGEFVRALRAWALSCPRL